MNISAKSLTYSPHYYCEVLYWSHPGVTAMIVSFMDCKKYACFALHIPVTILSISREQNNPGFCYLLNLVHRENTYLSICGRYLIVDKADPMCISIRIKIK